MDVIGLSWTEVVEPVNVFRLASEHALVMASGDPCRPAKAGCYTFRSA